MEMAIRAPDNLQLLHIWLQWSEHHFETLVIQLVTELLELQLLALTFTCCRNKSLACATLKNKQYILLGIGRNVTGITAFLCPQHAVFVMIPGET
jgi:hypothetical protein